MSSMVHKYYIIIIIIIHEWFICGNQSKEKLQVHVTLSAKIKKEWP